MILSSCNFTNYYLYNKDKTNGVDFSKGKWLLGEIDVNKDVKDDLTNLVLKNFKEILAERIKYTLTEKTLLLPSKTPLNPTKSQIQNLKKGTNYDYFINIKCSNSRNDLSDFKLIEHSYYIKQMSFALFTLEIYDLNQGKIIYTQTASGNIEEDMSITFRPAYNIIMGCEKRIIKDIRKKSILNKKTI